MDKSQDESGDRERERLLLFLWFTHRDLYWGARRNRNRISPAQYLKRYHLDEWNEWLEFFNSWEHKAYV